MKGTNKLPKIIGMIPAKLGSTRLPMKNLALLNGKPLIYYPVQAAKDAKAFDRIVINSEDRLFRKIAERYKVEFYQRPSELVSPDTKTDTVVYDFLLKNPCDIVVWVSPIAPFQPAEEIKDIIDYFISERLDSLMTVKDEQVHCVYKNKPVNFNIGEIFAQTQNLIPIQPFVYSIMMWRSEIFIREFEEKGYALMCGKTGYFPVSKFSSIIIKKKEDLILADSIMKAISKESGYKVKYDGIIKD